MIRAALAVAGTALATTGSIVNIEFAHAYLPSLSSVRNGSLSLRLFVYLLVKITISLALPAATDSVLDMQIVYAHAAQFLTEVYVVFVLILCMA